MILPVDLARKVIKRKWEGIENILKETDLIDTRDEETMLALHDYFVAVRKLQERIQG